tara:strand:+ start:646 stop:942 length:297 start_codon:yes stop_codon:yes gene_type:complete
MKDLKDLKDLSIIELEGKKKSIMLKQAGFGALGTISGWIYANRTGGGFWRYLGFGFMGGAIVGVTGYFISYQKINDINTIIEQKKASSSLSNELAESV